MTVNADVIDELREIVGKRVSVSPSELYCYSSDASQVRGLPDYVLRPLNTEEVSRIVRLAYEREIPVTVRGAGTGLAGGAVPVKGGIVLDMSGMDRIVELDIDNIQVVVEPGVIQDKLNEALKPLGFFFPPNPGSSAMCTIGGMIAYNASGMRCVKYGTTRNYVRDLEVVLADGKVIHTGSRMLKSAAGYDLTQLMVGSEGTLGIITKASLKIAPLPKTRKLVMAAFESAELAGKAVVKTFSSGVVPSACEILDRVSLKVLKRYDPNLVLPAEGDVILFEVDGTENSAREAAAQVMEVCSGLALTLKLAESEEEMTKIWAARRLVGAAVSRLDPTKSRIYVGEDVGVPMKQIPKLLEKVQEISEEFELPAMKYGHIGDGNLHVALFIDVLKEDEWARLNAAADKIHRTAIELGGTVSSEHGVGAARGQYMELQWGPAFGVMRTIKNALDPKGILNPGKLGL
ncbi:MAG: FAD-binding oxidoreductase [Methanosarcinaceae archaeon]|nr:FAD-binding oxidoreductase [Methanosarcinaceae archaeon]MDD4497187.1 FAD-binding oxidoreductase [Methanosarcinaceae archaeon]